MKILAIRGENLASLGTPFEVWLDEGPLKDCGLFAITGQTGSGKTTLLDAVCLALYDTTPRLDATGGARIGRATDDESLRLQANDVRGVLSRGKVSGFAEVDFVGADGKRHRARWEVRRSRNKLSGRVQTTDRSLMCLDTDTVVAGKKREVQTAILDVIGLSFEQFRRSALLAQGEFAAFLKAGEDERAELLERMTGTEIYSRLSVAAFERQKAEFKAWKELERAVEALGVMPLEDRQAIEEQRTQARVLAEQCKAELSSASLAHRWWQEHANLRERVDAGQRDVDAAAIEAAQAEPQRATLKATEGAQALRPAVEGADGAAARADAAKKGLAAADETVLSCRASTIATATVVTESKQAHAESTRAWEQAQVPLKAAEVLDSRLAELREQEATASELSQTAQRQRNGAHKTATEATGALEQAHTERANAKTWIDAHPHAHLLQARWAQTEPAISVLVDTTARLPIAQAELDEAVASAALATSAAKNAAQAATDARAIEAAGTAALSAAKDRVPPMARKMAEAKRARTQGSAQHAVVVLGLAETATSTAAAAAAAHAEMVQTTSILENAQLERRTLESDRQTLGIRLQEAAAALSRAAAAASLEDRRHTLINGEPCDLCGSTDHPWATGETQAPTVSVQAQRVAELEGLRDENVAAMQALANRQGTTAANADQAGRLHATLTQDLDRLCAEWSDARTDRPTLPDSPIDPTALSLAQAWVETSQADVARAEAALADIATLELGREQASDALEQARADRDAVENAAALARTATDQAQALVRQSTEALSHVQRTQDRSLGELTESLRGRPEWRERILHDPAATAAALRQEVADYSHHTQVGARLTEQMPALTASQATAEQQYKGALSAADTASAALVALADRRAAATVERASLLQGRSVAEVRAELKSALTQAADALTAALDTHTAAQVATGKAEGQQAEARARLAQTAIDRDSADARLHRAVQASPLDLPEIRALLTRDGVWIAAERARLRAIDEAVSQSRTRLKERQDRLQAHLDPGQPEVAADEAAATLAAATQANQQAIDGLAGLAALISQDDRARDNAAEQQIAIDAQKQIYDRWRSLDDVIGSSSGKRFRNFAQGLTLDVLLAHANTHLESLAPRYRLDRVPGEHLALQVIDQDMGDEIRSVNSLSGGESFLTSLALALGLSSLSAAHTTVDSLFIDEGFGTLDAETLDLAFEALNTLQSAGRQVGIISHVDALTERVGVQIRVERLGAGRSRVVVAETYDAPAP